MNSSRDKNGAHGGAAGGITRDGNSGGGEKSKDSSSTSPVKSSKVSYQHGHSFIKKNFPKPVACHYCGEMLWGLIGQGYVCEGRIL